MQRTKVRPLGEDPFLSDETDPAEAKAMASSFWEVAIILSQENDETVR